MTQFELYAKRNILEVRKKSPLTSGSVNVNTVQFTFSDDWKDLEKRAVFKTDLSADQPIAVIPDGDGMCSIPWEVLATANRLLYAGIYGTKGGKTVLPTIWACIGKVLQGSSPGESGRAPTPDPWGQLKEEVEWAKEYLGKPPVIQDGTWWTWDAEAGEYKDTEKPARGETGARGEKGEPGAMGPAGPQGLTGETGKSAYEYAHEAGYSGDEEQFAQELARVVSILDGNEMMF